MVSLGLTFHLVMTAGVFFLAVSMLVWMTLKHPIAWLIGFIKVLIPLVYFSWFMDGSWLVTDAVSYFNDGIALTKTQYTPYNIFLEPGGLVKMFSLAGGLHIFYIWYNFFAIELIGEFYYSPVFFNVFFSVIGGIFLYKTAILLEFKKQYSKLLFIFFLLHWDILSWSSFVNLKDTFLVTMICITMYLLIKIQKKFSWLNLFIVALMMWAFIFVRFYLPILIIGSFFMAYFINLKTPFKYTKALLILPPILMFSLLFASNRITSQFGYLSVDPLGIAQGIGKFLLTPRPWDIDDRNSFLVFSANMHLLFLIPAFLGGWLLWKNYPQIRIILVFLILVLLLYGSSSILQGPRHRQQISFIFSWCQFHFLWCFLSFFASKSSEVYKRLLNKIQTNIQRNE